MKNAVKAAMFVAVAAMCCTAAVAQLLYRIVDPDGRVTFSDQAPAFSANAQVSIGRVGSFSEGAGDAALPFELRGVVQRFPVTLYTSKDCLPCDAGRNLLRSRGVPFAERTVEDSDDVAALKRLAGDTRLPMATVGGQQMKGFSDAEWSQFLDAAGYPKTSQLPKAYRNPAPAPLVAKAVPAPASAPATALAPAPAPALAAPPNPAGIRF